MLKVYRPPNCAQKEAPAVHAVANYNVDAQLFMKFQPHLWRIEQLREFRSFTNAVT